MWAWVSSYIHSNNNNSKSIIFHKNWSSQKHTQRQFIVQNFKNFQYILKKKYKMCLEIANKRFKSIFQFLIKYTKIN